MPSTISIIDKLKRDYPDFTFTPGDVFYWSPESHTVYYSNLTDTASLIHETAHAVLGHKGYTRDIELLVMERDAWEFAVRTLSKRYGVTIDRTLVETMLDTYRDWLHARSTCPGCQATGLQTAAHRYTCIACGNIWNVNEARVTALRRYSLAT